MNKLTLTYLRNFTVIKVKGQKYANKICLPLCFFLATLPSVALSQTQNSPVRVVVNSNQDGVVQADEALTLREAIQVVNGTLPVEQLSSAEKAQVQPADGTASRIEFNLPVSETTINVEQQLPPLATPGLVVDATTQPGYDASRSATAEIAIPIPVVEITPASGKEVLRGLTVVADGVTIRGLSIYGFGATPQKLTTLSLSGFGPQETTLTTPPGDIFISHRLPPPNTSEQYPPNDDAPFYASNVPPKNVVIENNWLGITPGEEVPENTSAFGVYVFNGVGTNIRRNRISYHEGSAIITSVRADNTSVTENIIVGNGIAGMPDAIRLEGNIANSQITANLICGNDGAGIYLFKPDGSVQIRDNQITFNGRRLRRAAVYLMGDDHQVSGNQIRYQTGPGVVVAAYPESDRNIIQNNQYGALEGLSIDLVAQQNVEPIHYQRGDGPNPKGNYPYQSQVTANNAINAPEFASSELVIVNGRALVSGTAPAGSQVEIYRVIEPSMGEPGYGPLTAPIATVTADAKGRFSTSLTEVQPGDYISATATLAKSGTSEPAYNALIRAVDGSGTTPTPGATPAPVTPQCVSAPPPPAEPTPEPVLPEPEPTPPLEPVRLRVPRNVHFALDKDFISPASAAVLDQVAQVLQQYPFIVIELEGHTDPRASNAYNLDLGRRRALSVRNYLLKQGVAPERMTIRSFGETQRRTEGSARVDYARDRRVEITFQDTRGLDIIYEQQEEDLQIEPGRR